MREKLYFVRFRYGMMPTTATVVALYTNSLVQIL